MVPNRWKCLGLHTRDRNKPKNSAADEFKGTAEGRFDDEQTQRFEAEKEVFQGAIWMLFQW